MKKENRLKKRKQFNWTFKNGISVHTKNLALVYTTSKARDFKIGFSVTKKVGKAVVRNKVKRRLKNIVQKYLNKIIGQRTMIFVAKPTAVDASFEDLTSQVETLLKKSKIYKDLDIES